MQLYPHVFVGLGTIKNAVAYLDVKPDAVPIVCSEGYQTTKRLEWSP